MILTGFVSLVLSSGWGPQTLNYSHLQPGFVALILEYSGKWIVVASMK